MSHTAYAGKECLTDLGIQTNPRNFSLVYWLLSNGHLALSGKAPAMLEDPDCTLYQNRQKSGEAYGVSLGNNERSPK